MPNYYKITYASRARHENWYRSADGERVESFTCILTEPGAQCVAPSWGKGDIIRGRLVKKVARLPQYVARRFEYVDSFR